MISREGPKRERRKKVNMGRKMQIMKKLRGGNRSTDMNFALFCIYFHWPLKTHFGHILYASSFGGKR